MLNKVLIEGRLTADPELRQTPSGVSVSRFRIAWNGQKDDAKFYDVVAWRNAAEFVCRNFRKGNGIAIDGHLDTNTYEAKIPQSNKTYTRTTVEIVADQVHFPVYSGKKEEQEAAPQFNAPENATFEEVESDENLPF